MDIHEIIARRAAINSERDALYDEDERLIGAMRRWGTHRARVAMLDAGLVTGESIVVERRVIRGVEHTYRMGILLAVGVDWGPASAGDDWTMCVQTRSVLKSGKPGRALDRCSFRVSDPADLTERMKVVGSTNRDAALSHPRIIRMSEVRKRIASKAS